MEMKAAWIILGVVLIIGLMVIIGAVLLLMNRQDEETEEPNYRWAVELWNINRGYQVGFYFNQSCVIGRLTLCQNAIGDVPPVMEQTVSREHCMLLEQNGGLLAWNMSAVNPTKLNGYRLNEPAWLSAGDRIELGDTAFLVTRADCCDY